LFSKDCFLPGISDAFEHIPPLTVQLITLIRLSNAGQCAQIPIIVVILQSSQTRV